MSVADDNQNTYGSTTMDEPLIDPNVKENLELSFIKVLAGLTK